MCTTTYVLSLPKALEMLICLIIAYLCVCIWYIGYFMNSFGRGGEFTISVCIGNCALLMHNANRKQWDSQTKGKDGGGVAGQFDSHRIDQKSINKYEAFGPN